MLIRAKLALRFTLLVLLIQLLFAGFVYWFFGASRERRFAGQLRAEAELSARLLVSQRRLSPDSLRAFRPRDVAGIAGEQLSVFDEQDRIVYTSADAQSLALHRAYRSRVRAGRSVFFQDDESETVGIDYAAGGLHYDVFAGGVDEDGFRQLQQLRLILLAGTLGALGLSVAAGRYFAGEALGPMARIVRQVRRITAERLSLRVDEGNRQDEIAQLAATFNQMLNGLEQAFASQKSFVAHASHELRTPLTTVLGTLETAADYDKNFGETQASIRKATAELRKLIDLSNGLLALARADESTFTGEIVRLDECLLQALDYCRSKYPGQAVHVSFGPMPEEAEEGYSVRGNTQLLTTAVLNVLDNALKFSQQPVTAALQYADAATLQLTITDQGPGLTAEEEQRAFEPLYRGPNGHHRPGHGIGLAVTEKVVQLHGGRVRLAPGPPRGTVATLTLPAAG